MNKTQLKQAVHAEFEKENLNKRQASDIVDFIIDTISDAVRAGDVVTIQNFATFKKVHRDARVAHNPRTREEVKVDAYDTMVVRPASAMKKL